MGWVPPDCNSSPANRSGHGMALPPPACPDKPRSLGYNADRSSHIQCRARRVALTWMLSKEALFATSYSSSRAVGREKESECR